MNKQGLRDIINDRLENYKRCTIEAYENKNPSAGWYLACIAGMWAHEWHCEEKNIFEGEDDFVDLYKWFGWGYDCNQYAVQRNDIEKKRREEEERQLLYSFLSDQEKKEKSKSKEKKSFWKLF